MKKSRITRSCIFLIAVLITAFFMAPIEPSQCLGAEAGEKSIELILDASGSMWGRLKNGELKIDAAKRAVETLVNKLPDNIWLSFRAYGHQSPRENHDCKDTALLVDFSPLSSNRTQVVSEAKKLNPKGYTPITYVLELASKDFNTDLPGNRIIILVSDGKETCQGDPCALAASLAESGANIVVHTVGFGVDSATKGQLECIAGATGGRYFSAQNTAELIEVLNTAVETGSTEKIKESGDGRLQVIGADLLGHIVTDAKTGEKVAEISRFNSTIKIPAGIYNVTIGKSVWKSVQVRSGQITVLEPGWIKMENASLSGHDIADMETGIKLNNNAALMPGQYMVLFGPLEWPVEIEAGKTTILKPGTVTVSGAGYKSHIICDNGGREVASVSQTKNWTPLPPGGYTIEIKDEKIPFTLKEDEHLVFENK